MKMKISRMVISILFYTLFINMLQAQDTSKPIVQNAEYSVFSNRIEQQSKFVAKTISASEIVSNYKSPANKFLSSSISFKFSINGRGNEMKPGVDHHVNYGTSITETNPIVFGEQFKPAESNQQPYLQPDTKLIIRLYLRKVSADFSKNGFYIDCNNNKIFKEDFKVECIAGGTAPMIWDFDNLVNHTKLQLKDNDGDGIYETTLIFNAAKDEKQTAAVWKLTKDISAYPQYKSPYLISDAIYNISLEEMVKAVEPDSTFRTGTEWV